MSRTRRPRRTPLHHPLHVVAQCGGPERNVHGASLGLSGRNNCASPATAPDRLRAARQPRASLRRCQEPGSSSDRSRECLKLSSDLPTRYTRVPGLGVVVARPWQQEKPCARLMVPDQLRQLGGPFAASLPTRTPSTKSRSNAGSTPRSLRSTAKPSLCHGFVEIDGPAPRLGDLQVRAAASIWWSLPRRVGADLQIPANRFADPLQHRAGGGASPGAPAVPAAPGALPAVQDSRDSGSARDPADRETPPRS